MELELELVQWSSLRSIGVGLLELPVGRLEVGEATDSFGV